MSEFRRRLLVQSKNDNPILDNYLTIVALEDGLTAKLSLNACEYCVDGNGNWKSLPADTETEAVNSGQTLSFRANLIPTSSDGIGTFTVNRYFKLKGNCMSLLFGDEAKDKFSLDGYNYAIRRLFLGNTKLIDASELVLQATKLSDYCYWDSFANCTSLVKPPILPATIISPYCYFGMFTGCTSLTASPELPATKLANSCYGNMFMRCQKLNYIKMMATDISAISCLSNWVNGVASSGTFVKNKYATWNVGGASGIPSGWEVKTE